MLRNIGAVVLGLFAGIAVNMGFIMLNSYMLFPMPEGMDMNDPEQMNAYVATLPTAAFLVVLIAHLGQSFVGGWGCRVRGRFPPDAAGDDHRRAVASRRDREHDADQRAHVDVYRAAAVPRGSVVRGEDGAAAPGSV